VLSRLSSPNHQRLDAFSSQGRRRGIMSGIKQGHGRKTREQILRTLERKDDVPKQREMEDALAAAPADTAKALRHADARQSAMAVSRHGMNQERFTTSTTIPASAATSRRNSRPPMKSTRIDRARDPLGA
jgi:hypothetical protein